MREETGLEVRIVRPFDDIAYTFVQGRTRIHKTVHYFLMVPTGGDLERHDHEFDEVRWIGFDEARDAPHLRDGAGARGPGRRGRDGWLVSGRAGARGIRDMTEIATPEPIPTPLLDRHEALGAKIVEFAGWLMPISYAGILEEHRAVRSAAGLFDLSHMGELVVEGPEAGAALAAALVTDPPSLAVGRAHYSMICAPDGGILDDLIVYRLAPERFMVVANASNARTVSDALAERLDGFGAVLDDRSLATGLVAIQGPRSRGDPRSR